MTVRGARPVDCKIILIGILSDGKQAAKDVGDKVEGVGVKVECVDDKVQVIIEGVRGVQSVVISF